MNHSGHDLIPHLNVLQHDYLHREELDHYAYRTAFYDLELLPYVLGAAGKAVSDLAAAQNRLAEEHHGRLAPNHIQGLGDDVRDELTYSVDGFLDAARRAQNAVIPYLRRGLRMSLPASMNKLMKALRAGRLEFPEKLGTNLDRYWTNHGERLKAYRDISQHHSLVTSDVRIFLADGRTAVYFVLPSNPEAKSARRLTFGSPPVHALSYLLDEFFALVINLHWITAGLVSATPRTRFAMGVFRDGLSLDMVGQMVLSPAELDAKIDELLEVLKQQAAEMLQ